MGGVRYEFLISLARTESQVCRRLPERVEVFSLDLPSLIGQLLFSKPQIAECNRRFSRFGANTWPDTFPGTKSFDMWKLPNKRASEMKPHEKPSPRAASI